MVISWNWAGGCAPMGRGSWVSIEHSVARAEAYLCAKFHLDPSNRLVTVHQRYRLRLYWVCSQTVTEDILLQPVLACCSALEVLWLCAI